VDENVLRLEIRPIVARQLW